MRPSSLATTCLLILSWASSVAGQDVKAATPRQGTEKASNEISPPAIHPSAESSEQGRAEKHSRHRFDKKFWGVWSAVLLLQAFDAGSTSYCVAQPNCEEGNPLFGKRPSNFVIFGIKGGVVAFHLWMSIRLRKDNQPEWIIPPLIMGGEGVYTAINNSLVLASLSSKRSALPGVQQSLSGQPVSFRNVTAQFGQCCDSRFEPSLRFPIRNSNFRSNRPGVFRRQFQTEISLFPTSLPAQKSAGTRR